MVGIFDQSEGGAAKAELEIATVAPTRNATLLVKPNTLFIAESSLVFLAATPWVDGEYSFATKSILRLTSSGSVVYLMLERYLSIMVNRVEKSAQKAAGMIARLGRLSHAQGFVCGLTAAQWSALRYFACANRFSRSLSAFANYHATTRGTVSQTVKSLVVQGLVTRIPSNSDGRSVRFDLSERGRVVYDQDPLKDLARAIAELPQGLQAELRVALKRTTDRMACVRQKPPFGTCRHCRHLEECVPHEDNVTDYFCRAKQIPLEQSTLEKICVDHEPGAGALKRGIDPSINRVL